MEQNYFLGSVGMVEAFRETDNGKELAFVSKTLTDSGLNTSITADDIRAGQGAPIVTRFYHDASVEITLTDVMFKRAYVEAQLGAKFSEPGEAGQYAYQLDELVGANGSITLKKMPHKIEGGCFEGDKIPVWFTKAGENDWHVKNLDVASKTIEDTYFKANEKYCARYLAEDSSVAVANIMADIIPEELHLIITVPLYAGDSCAASSGRAAGEVQFDIPRFRLNGSQDFAAAMSSNQTMSLAGVAMASYNSCDTSAILYTMRVKYNNTLEVENAYTMLETLGERNIVGEVPVVYGIKPNLEAVVISNDLIDFPEGYINADTGVWTSAAINDGNEFTITLHGTRVTERVKVLAA